MTDDFDEYFYEDDEEIYRPRDAKINEAKDVLMSEYFPENGAGVYYGRQLEIWLERTFFHWITKKGLNELFKEGRIGFKSEKAGHLKAHFYYPRRHRYPRRQIKQTLSLIAEFSDPEFTRALGHHGELLDDSGFANIGFRIIQRKVREVDGKRWTETNHDLDRLIIRDGERYGVEIKNQLGYIDQTEFQIKLKMCRHFGVRPMFITRMMPKSYNYEVYKAGGFSLILENQHYPLMAGNLAKRVREWLRLPVLSISTLPDTAMRRFEEWHEKKPKRQ
jgi:hypothetical protein